MVGISESRFDCHSAVTATVMFSNNSKDWVMDIEI